MKWIGVARIYDKATGHFKCRRRVYGRDNVNVKKLADMVAAIYVLRFSRIEGYRYKRIDLAKYKVEEIL